MENRMNKFNKKSHFIKFFVVRSYRRLVLDVPLLMSNIQNVCTPSLPVRFLISVKQTRHPSNTYRNEHLTPQFLNESITNLHYQSQRVD